MYSSQVQSLAIVLSCGKLFTHMPLFTKKIKLVLAKESDGMKLRRQPGMTNSTCVLFVLETRDDHWSLGIRVRLTFK